MDDSKLPKNHPYSELRDQRHHICGGQKKCYKN